MRQRSPVVLIQDARQDNHNASPRFGKINLLIRCPDSTALPVALPIGVKSLTNRSLCFVSFLICRMSGCLAISRGACFC